jgi:Zn-dependent protease
MFTSPPPTRYDLRFSILGINVRVHPLFWVIAILLGSSSSSPINILIWVVSVFVSILIHELGHALAMRYYGQRSQIVLHTMGGLTIPEPVAWGTGWAHVALMPNQEIFITLAGPGAGFLFAAFIFAFTIIINTLSAPITGLPGTMINLLIGNLLWINIFWGLINLMPIYPLDGGNVARHLFVKFDPWGGVRKSLWLSIIAGGIAAMAGFFLLGSIYMAVLFAFLAFQSYQMLQGGINRGY